MSVNYTPAPSVEPFLTADKFANFVVGPVGSTKTTAAIMKIAYEARRVKACSDGIRRSRCVVVRNTRQMLWDTTIPDFLNWFPDGAAGLLMKTDSKFLLRFDDVECEVLFRGLDDANDVRRLLSLQLTFGVMDEFREINPEIYNALTGRLGRYPNKKMNGVGACDDDGNQIYKVWGATNPPDSDTFWEELLSDPPENVHVTIQPSGMSEEADWLDFLPDNYYPNLCEGKTDDWIDVYVHGKFGRSLAGQPVYERSFVEDFHTAKGKLLPQPNSDNPIIIGIDFGRTPCAVFKQRDVRGRVLTLAELTSENMGIETFVRTLLVPFVTGRFPGYPMLCAPDPAGFMKQQLNELTLVDVLKNAGFECVKPPSNKPEYRIQAVERLLAQQIDGEAMYLIDPSCTMLLRGFRHGYRYRRKTNGVVEDKPEKNEYSHCFVGDTPVLTTCGEKRIEDVRPGDFVITRQGPKEVLATMSSRSADLVRVEAGGRSVIATTNHPFIVDDKKVRADALEYVCRAELTLEPTNTPRLVTAVSAVVTKLDVEPMVVYDLTVADAHEFFVADMLVSNCHDANQYADSILDLQQRGSTLSRERREVKKVAYAWT